MKKIFFAYLFCLFNCSNCLIGDNIGFNYYDIVIKIDSNDISFSNDYIINPYKKINLSTKFNKLINNIFVNKNFDNYMIIDFINNLSKYMEIRSNINSLNYEIGIINELDFEYILFFQDNNSVYDIAIRTDMSVNNTFFFNKNKYYSKKYNNTKACKIVYIKSKGHVMSYNMNKWWSINKEDTIIAKNYYYNDTLFYVDYLFNIKYISYLQHIPFIFEDTTFNIPKPSEEMFNNIKKIEKCIEGFSISDKINFLLRICQNVPYSDDIDLYGSEHLLMPESTLCLNVGDCDDKSLLFSYLVYYILKYKTILIIYPNGEHVNVGVEVDDSEIQNKMYVEVGGSKFIICEPTGIWYEAGMQIDSIDISNPKIIFPVFH